MVQEHAPPPPRCAAGGGGRQSASGKKSKAKKIPQRGLGVAQLEKMRLEEQRKIRAAALPFHSGGLAGVLPPPPPPAPAAFSGVDVAGACSWSEGAAAAAVGGFLPMLLSGMDVQRTVIAPPQGTRFALQAVDTALSLTGAAAPAPPELPSAQISSSSSGASGRQRPKRPWPFQLDGAPEQCLAGSYQLIAPPLSKSMAPSTAPAAEWRMPEPPVAGEGGGLSSMRHCVRSSPFENFTMQQGNAGALPFYTFLPPARPAVCDNQLKGQKSKEPDGIDLDLKLGNS